MTKKLVDDVIIKDIYFFQEIKKIIKYRDYFQYTQSCVCEMCGQLFEETVGNINVRIRKHKKLLCKSCAYKKFCLEKYGQETHYTKELFEKTVAHTDQKERIETLKKNNLEKYGVEHNFQREDIKKKIKEKIDSKSEQEKQAIKEKRAQTCLEKYGVDSPFKSIDIKEKIKNTNLERYGVENAAQSNIIKEKQHNTNLKRYGHKSPLQNKSIKEKSKNTILEKYGVENVSQNKEIAQKISKTLKKVFKENYDDIRMKAAKTCLERYGTEFAQSSEEVKNKIKEGHFKSHGSWYFQTEEYKQNIIEAQRQEGINTIKKKCEEKNLIFLDEENYRGLYDHKNHCLIYYKFFCKKCNKEIFIAPHCELYCQKCEPKVFSGISKSEKEVLEFIRSFYSDEILCNKKIISPYEIDIYLPKLKIGIEYNGSYWHSIEKKDKNFHKMKTQMCLEKGIHLINLFDYDWTLKQDKIKSFLKTIIMKDNIKIYARKCEIKSISSKIANNFCDENHLQKGAPAKVYLGLFNNNELFQVMTFSKSRFSKNYEWEMIRECSKIGFTIIGGKSKLLRFFENNYKPNSIVSYCDTKFFNGDSYEKCGFNLKSWSEPNYVYTSGLEVFSRYQCQKHKLIEKYGDTIKNKTEYEIMTDLGFNKVYDCGNYVYEKFYKDII